MPASTAHNGISSESDGSPNVEAKMNRTADDLAIKARLLAETRLRFTKLTLLPNSNPVGNPGVAGVNRDAASGVHPGPITTG